MKSDEKPADALVAMKPDAVVLSPGPGHPRDAGCFTELLELLPGSTPVLGVCLGHQAIGLEAGGTVDRTAPMHGKASFVYHEGRGILEGIGVPFEAGRYHSLVVERDDLPEELELTAWTDDGLVMATQHRDLPRFGVQFHPESILTPRDPGSSSSSSSWSDPYGTDSRVPRRTPRCRARPGTRARRRRRTLAPGSA